MTRRCERWSSDSWSSVQRLIQHTRPHAALYSPKAEQALLLFFAGVLFCLLRRWCRSSRGHVGLAFHWLVLGVSLGAGTLHRLMLLWQSRRLTPVTRTADRPIPPVTYLTMQSQREIMAPKRLLTNKSNQKTWNGRKEKVAKSTFCKQCRARGQKEIAGSDVSVTKYG